MSTWTITASLEKWESVASSIKDELNNFGFTNRFINSLMLAMDEAVSNIVLYAYDSGGGNIVINSDYEDNLSQRMAKITFVDFGKEFNPLENAAEPNANEQSSTKRKIGGWGIFLIKKNTDELRYSYSDSSNRLSLIKKEMY